MRDGADRSELRRYLSSLSRVPDEPAQQIVAEALGRVDVDVARQSRGRGTVSTEPLIVAQGQHSGDFELFAADARALGVATRRRRAYELRDTSEQLIFELRARSSIRGFATKWRYDLTFSGGQTILIERSSRVGEAAVATIGARQVGMLRPRRASSLLPRAAELFAYRMGARTPAVAVEDDTQHERAWIYVARIRRLHGVVELVAQIDDSASDELRQLAVAAILITEREFIGWSSGGG
jgi:hypothetical protein